MRVGRAIELDVAAASRAEAEARVRADVRQAARQSGHRGLPARGGGRPDAARWRRPVSRAATATTTRSAPPSGSAPSAYFVWHRDTDLQGADVVILPGGFSYGDYLRSGAIARFSPIMQAVQRARGRGGPVLGICNGFQILCEAHLLPGALHAERRPHVRVEAGGLRVERTDTLFTSAYAAGARLRHAGRARRRPLRGRRRHARALEAEGRVVLRYVAAAEASPFSPTRTAPRNDIAGISQRRGHRGRHHAASRARRRPAARLDGRARVLHVPRGLAAARHHRLSGSQPMTTDKPSRNEDEYFAQQDAELHPEAARAGRGRRAPTPSARSHYMKCPKDGVRPGQQPIYHGVQIDDLPPLRRHVARRRRGGAL